MPLNFRYFYFSTRWLFKYCDTNWGSSEAGIQSVVKKLKGNELKIIPILMILFSIGGSTYGMAEETIPFYGLLSATMVAAGFDTFVAVGTVLLGAGSGVIGSTVNPFSTGVAMDALRGIVAFSRIQELF